MENYEEMKKIILIILILLGVASISADYYIKNIIGDEKINTNECLNFNNDSRPLLISRVPINNSNEINREYLYNNSWIKECK